MSPPALAHQSVRSGNGAEFLFRDRDEFAREVAEFLEGGIVGRRDRMTVISTFS